MKDVSLGQSKVDGDRDGGENYWRVLNASRRRI